MNKIKIMIVSIFMASPAFAGSTAIYQAYAPTVVEAQAIVDLINSGEINISDCGSQGGQVYDVNFPSLPMTARVNRFGMIEVEPSKTIFKIACNGGAGDR
jgi:hypothetical protein